MTALLTWITSGRTMKFARLRESGVCRIGFAIALCNVVGAYALLGALKSGPLFAVSMIYNQSFIVSIVLVVIFHQERLTRRRGVLLAAAVLSMFLLEGEFIG